MHSVDAADIVIRDSGSVIQSVQFKMQPQLLHMNPFTHKTTKKQYFILVAVYRCYS
jgi:hypothetical protein